MHPLTTLAPAVLLALAAAPAAAQLVDTTAPGPLESLGLALVNGRAEIDARLPADDDVTQARFRFADATGAELARHYAPAGPGEHVHVALPVPPGATLLHAGVADGSGNAGPEASAAVDGSLRALTIQRETTAPAAIAAAAAGLLAAVGRRK